MTDEVDELPRAGEGDEPLADDLEADSDGLGAEPFASAGFDGDFDGAAGVVVDDQDDDLDGVDLADAGGPNVITRRSTDDKRVDPDEEDLEGLPEDIEASLDEILRAQLKSSDEEGVIDLREDAEENRAMREFSREDGGAVPRQADEFVCRSCFLVKHRRQLVDTDRGFCRDCA